MMATLAAERARTRPGVWREYERPARDQLFLVPVSMRDWVEDDHLVWFVLDVVEQMSTQALHVRPAGAPGRRPYEPEMMLALVLYGYCCGIRFSRRLEAACLTDAAFRIICGGLTPDHATIARFISDHERALEGLFVEGLRLCAAAGLADLSVVALDGTKIAADASLDRNRDAAWIRAEVTKLMTATGAENEPSAVTVQFDSLQSAVSASPRGRRGRLEAALAIVEAQDAVLSAEAKAFRAAAEADAQKGLHRMGRKPLDPHAALVRAQIDQQVAIRRLAEQHELIATAAASVTATGRRPEGLKRPHMANAKAGLARAEAALTAAQAAVAEHSSPGGRVNVTDPDSRIMKTKDGWVQGYNCQAIVNHQIVLACDVSQSATDITLFEPMNRTLHSTLNAAGISDPVQLELADAGYCSEHNLTCPGPDRLIATTKDWKQRAKAQTLGQTTGPPPPDGTAADEMEHLLRTPQGHAAYKQRSQLIEHVFGDTKHNRQTRTFRRRGLTANQSEWAFINLARNLRTLHHHTHAA